MALRADWDDRSFRNVARTIDMAAAGRQEDFWMLIIWGCAYRREPLRSRKTPECNSYRPGRRNDVGSRGYWSSVANYPVAQRRRESEGFEWCGFRWYICRSTASIRLLHFPDNVSIVVVELRFARISRMPGFRPICRKFSTSIFGAKAGHDHEFNRRCRGRRRVVKRKSRNFCP